MVRWLLKILQLKPEQNYKPHWHKVLFKLNRLHCNYWALKIPTSITLQIVLTTKCISLKKLIKTVLTKFRWLKQRLRFLLKTAAHKITKTQQLHGQTVVCLPMPENRLLPTKFRQQHKTIRKSWMLIWLLWRQMMHRLFKTPRLFYKITYMKLLALTYGKKA